jgi:hypothetical protein
LQRIAPEAPFERACRLIVLADELRGVRIPRKENSHSTAK